MTSHCDQRAFTLLELIVAATITLLIAGIMVSVTAGALAPTREALSRRDRLDAGRAASPMAQAPDAVVVDSSHVSAADVPVVICGADAVLRNPDNAQIADCLGFNDAIDRTRVSDLIIVGAGPAGLAAAVYGASEGLEVLVLVMGVDGPVVVHVHQSALGLGVHVHRSTEGSC